jgi:ABC-2 type transport system ATP-binding protein
MVLENIAIACAGLRKRFGKRMALDGLDLTVPLGGVHGLLGRNGAGKTTTVRVLATLLRPDSGCARVVGFDVARQASAVRARIGLAGQHAAVDEILSGRQNLVMFGRLYHLPAQAARRRADELLDQFALADAGAKPVRQYSGGMRRRLDLAASFIVAPRVLFLDEPTAGLDPHGRNEVWQTIRALAVGGTTVLLTTQYLDEADRLADTITVIAAGRVIAGGTPDELKSLAGGDRVDVMLREASDLGSAARLLRARLGTDVRRNDDTRTLGIQVTDRRAALIQIISSLEEAGITTEDVAVRRPTLDEAFLHLTGQQTSPDSTVKATIPPAGAATP